MAILIVIISLGTAMLMYIGHRIMEESKVTKKLRGREDSIDSFGGRYSFDKAVVDTDGFWHINDALSEFKDEISELDREIKYAEEVKRLEKEKADKKSYLDSLYLEDDEKDVVYSVEEASYDGMFMRGVYATLTEAKDVKQKVGKNSRAFSIDIKEHTLNRPKKEDE